MKRVFLYVGGSDYSALDFSENYIEQQFYEEMLKEGVQEKIIDKGEIYTEVYIKEFGEIDDNFISFIRDNFIEYAKDTNFFEVKAK